MKIVDVDINQITPYENNPRNNDGAVDAVANSIKEFGFKQPIVVDEHGIVIVGHTRLKAAKQLGLETVPVLYAEDLSAEKVRAYRLADNKTGELAEWDWEALQAELEGLSDDFIMSEFGFDDLDDLIEEEGNPYTGKVEIPIYEPTGDQPLLIELIDTDKQEQLNRKIDAADIPEDVKTFLKVAATRHVVFNYAAIAEYYAHASKDVQALFEDSALVIIDYDKAIENGYVKLAESISSILDEDEDG